METCHNSSQHNFLKSYLSCQKGCHKEHKGELDHLGRLDSHQRKLGAVACLCQNKNCSKKNNPKPCIHPGKILEKFHLADHNRDHQSHCTSERNDQKLLIGRGNIQPAQHYKSNA